MNDQDNDFGALRKLLSLKQHEVPPPGYFHDFSGEVVARIRAGDGGAPDGLASRLLAEAPWLLKLIQSFQEKPAVAGVFASALCLLLVAGIVYTDNSGVSSEDFLPPQTAEVAAPMAVASAPTTAFVTPADSQATLISSTNPVLSLDPATTTFGAQNPLFQQVGFSH